MFQWQWNYSNTIIDSLYLASHNAQFATVVMLRSTVDDGLQVLWKAAVKSGVQYIAQGHIPLGDFETSW